MHKLLHLRCQHLPIQILYNRVPGREGAIEVESEGKENVGCGKFVVLLEVDLKLGRAGEEFWGGWGGQGADGEVCGDERVFLGEF